MILPINEWLSLNERDIWSKHPKRALAGEMESPSYSGFESTEWRKQFYTFQSAMDEIQKISYSVYDSISMNALHQISQIHTFDEYFNSFEVNLARFTQDDVFDRSYPTAMMKGDDLIVRPGNLYWSMTKDGLVSIGYVRTGTITKNCAKYGWVPVL